MLWTGPNNLWLVYNYGIHFLFPAVIAEVDTDVNITFSVKPQDLEIQYVGKTFTTNDTLSISLIAHESLQISANVDLTGEK